MVKLKIVIVFINRVIDFLFNMAYVTKKFKTRFRFIT